MAHLKIKEYLERNQESTRQLSKSVGLSRTTILRLTNPKIDFDPRLSTLIAVAKHFNCRVEELISEEVYETGGNHNEIC